MGRQRIEPGPGQESVWDYPRPPRLEDVDEEVKVVFGGVTLAYTTRAKRVLETSHPPAYYVPPEDLSAGHLRPPAATAPGQPRPRADPPARLLRPAGRHQDGAPQALVRHLLLRVEGTHELLRRGDRGPDGGAGGVVLPLAHRLLQGPQVPRGLLPVQDG